MTRGGLIPARIPISPKLGLAKELEKLDRNLARTLKGLEADDARMARETEEKIASARADAEREKQELQAAGYYRIEGDLNQSLVLLDANLQKTVTALEEALKSQRAKQPESIEKAKQTTESGKKRLQGLMASVQGGDDWIDALKLPLQKEDLATLESISGVGLMLGAGIALYTAPCDILDHSQNFTEFFSNESCGKCVPCRIGSTKLARMGHELLENRKARPLSLELVEGVRGDVLAINEALGVTSICSLGQVAGSPLAKALAYFADELQNPQPV